MAYGGSGLPENHARTAHPRSKVRSSENLELLALSPVSRLACRSGYSSGKFSSSRPRIQSIEVISRF